MTAKAAHYSDCPPKCKHSPRQNTVLGCSNAIPPTVPSFGRSGQTFRISSLMLAGATVATCHVASIGYMDYSAIGPRSGYRQPSIS